MVQASVIRQIVDASYSRPGIGALSLGYVPGVSHDELQYDILKIINQEKGSEVTKETHPTYWTNPGGRVVQYSCMNTEGRFDGTECHPHHPKYFHSEDRYPALGKFIREWPDALNFRINVFGPNSQLAPHQEQIVVRTPAGVRVKIRMHYPMFTSPQAYMMVAWQQYQFKEGGTYFLNNGAVHAAGNNGMYNRVHLVWDTYYTPGCLVDTAARMIPVSVWAPWDKYPAESEHVSYEEAIRCIS